MSLLIAVIGRIQGHALESIVDKYGETEDDDFDDFSELDPYYLDKMKKIVRDEFGLVHFVFHYRYAPRVFCPCTCARHFHV